MKRLFISVAFVIGVIGAFGFKPSSFALNPKANDGHCTAGNLDTPPSGTCAKQTNGSFCTVTIGLTAYNAYDGSCTSGNEIKHN
jgi:hypothetical protein